MTERRSCKIDMFKHYRNEVNIQCVQPASCVWVFLCTYHTICMYLCVHVAAECEIFFLLSIDQVPYRHSVCSISAFVSELPLHTQSNTRLNTFLSSDQATWHSHKIMWPHTTPPNTHTHTLRVRGVVRHGGKHACLLACQEFDEKIDSTLISLH